MVVVDGGWEGGAWSGRWEEEGGRWVDGGEGNMRRECEEGGLRVLVELIHMK